MTIGEWLEKLANATQSTEEDSRALQKRSGYRDLIGR